MVVLLLGGKLVEYFFRLAQAQLGGEAWLSVDHDFAVHQVRSLLLELGQVFAPILGLLLLAAVLVHVLQTGLMWVPQKLALDPSRINPLSGFQRLFSLTNAVRLVMGLFKVLIVSLVAFWSLYHRRDEILGISAPALPQIASFIVDITLWTSLKIALALLVLAIADYAYQRWKYEQDLRMSPQEVREEMKNLQGDPQVLARRRQVQRQLALHRVSSAVPKADVVVTNPTELAVAIQYDPTTMNVPIVVAKGAAPWRRASGGLRWNTASPCWSASRWLRRSTKMSTSTIPSPTNCTPRWPSCWRTSTSSRASPCRGRAA